MNYLKEINEETYLRITRTFGGFHGPDFHQIKIPETLRGHYAVVDESGLALRGIIAATLEDNYMGLSQITDDIPLHCSTLFTMTEEIIELNQIILNFPFPFLLNVSPSAHKRLGLEAGVLFRADSFKWSFSGRDDSLKSFLVEKNYSEQDLNSFLHKLYELRFYPQWFAYEPGRGLVFPAESSLLRGRQ